MSAAIAVRRSTTVLRPDSRRVIAKLFVPGQEGLIDGESRAGSVMERVMTLDDSQVATALAEVTDLFAPRYRDVRAMLTEHFQLVAHRVPSMATLSADRRLLVGAYFTQEYAVEAAAVCNPSLVAHPDQDGVSTGDTRVVMSVRAIGEGHRSSIEFRTGIVDEHGDVTFDALGPYLVAGRPGKVQHRRERFRHLLGSGRDDRSSVAFVLGVLPDPFSREQLEAALTALSDQLLTRRNATGTIERIRAVADSNYEVTFPEASALSERVLSPVAPTESHGMEDARFVRFVDDDGTVAYYATYTGYDGDHITSQLLATVDFRTFTSTPLSGLASTNKGMALFPRRVDGHYVALSRWDRSTNSVVTSDELTDWQDPQVLQRPSETWDVIQLGNCGSPIETDAGWIALTHGVGPMRRYVIGAELLDLHDPSRVIGHLREPLLVPADDERDGYVPNVVYSCGALLHAGQLVIPYGMSDTRIGVATVAVDQLLDALTGSSAG